jgi:hypothetical protein
MIETKLSKKMVRSIFSAMWEMLDESVAEIQPQRSSDDETLAEEKQPALVAFGCDRKVPGRLSAA